MEAPRPMPTKNYLENIFLDFNLIYNNVNYKCTFYNINNEKIRINITSNNNKYNIELNLSELKKLNKYFKMFDSLKELEDNLIVLKNNQKIAISKIDKEYLYITINVPTLENNIVVFQLSRTELTDKEKISLILKENEEIKKELKLKDYKINELEKEIIELKNMFLDFKYRVEDRLNMNAITISNTSSNNLELNSNIFLNKKEKKFILNHISNNIKRIDLVFNSLTDSNDVNKLKKAYLNKNNLLFVIKTKKKRRFGAFSSQKFLENPFNISDSKAFLFSLDNLAIYKSKNSEYTIWNSDSDSIQFGAGTDLRINYDFSSNKNYVSKIFESYNYQNSKGFYILNGESNFSIDIFEIFQIHYE